MLKIGDAQLAAVSARGAASIRSLVEKVASLEAQNVLLLEKLANVERDQEISQLAKEMEEKGLNADMTFEEKVANLRGHAHLENVKEAVKIAAAGGIQIANVSDHPGTGSLDPLTTFCLMGD
jgi:hypothetical protein